MLFHNSSAETGSAFDQNCMLFHQKKFMWREFFNNLQKKLNLTLAISQPTLLSSQPWPELYVFSPQFFIWKFLSEDKNWYHIANAKPPFHKGDRTWKYLICIKIDKNLELKSCSIFNQKISGLKGEFVQCLPFSVSGRHCETTMQNPVLDAKIANICAAPPL